MMAPTKLAASLAVPAGGTAPARPSIGSTQAARSDTAPPRCPAHRVVKSHDLLAGHRVLIIQHGSDEYRLHLTRGGKLILTK
jgi:hemin uptake protein HemP